MKHFSISMAGLFAILSLLNTSVSARESQLNIAPRATVTVSDILDEQHGAQGINDEIIGYDGRGEWACSGSVTPWGIMHMPRVRLEWNENVTVERVIFYDRATLDEHLAGGTLHFSDGTSLSVTAIPNDGGPRSISFEPRTVKWIEFEATDGAGKDIGLSEIEVYPAFDENTEYIDWVDPWIETTRGRWFYCTPGARPTGMVSAHAFTRNKNQGGGGYNYNFDEILGFSQINSWMLTGPNVMPACGDVDLSLGINGWKSRFSHDSEIIRPGYHRLFLDRYKAWVEYTSTDRTAFYRVRYTGCQEDKLIVDLGSVLGSNTMTDGVVHKIDDNTIGCEFSTVDRFWGGPDNIKLFFVLKSNRPIKNMDVDDKLGAVLGFGKDDSGELLYKIGMSYTSIENAAINLGTELPGWDFDGVVEETRAIWNEFLGRIDVKGGTDAQRVKFYTDLWHVLIGRRKINDINGWYPDYTWGEYVDHRTSVPMKLRRLPMDASGRPAFNMYCFDSLWLTQWNLNVVWGLAWPELLDDFSAGLVQYADNGGLLPRGACGGGYSFIMTGCPASNLILSTYQKGIMHKTDPLHAYEAVKKNHGVGGMMSFENPDDLKFYIKKGWCPGNAGKTLEWAFQDWGLAQMAKKLGKKADAKEFERRSHGWKALYDKESGLIFPKDAKGAWVHRSPLNGDGWIEANSWQGTWEVSHDLDALVEMMGGGDAFCEKLNYAFEKASPSDFVNEYSDGYVSYANQPGCSNAHLFSYAGKPWLTQYWVRQVKEKAFGGITPDLGYGGHDEDEGQMGGVSAQMAIGLFSVTGTESLEPYYDITSPIFDRITIKLNPDYYPGDKFEIITYNNSAENCYIQKASLNKQPWQYSQFGHDQFIAGGSLEIWLGPEINTDWGELKYRQ